MIYEGKNLSCQKVEGDFVELQLDAQEGPINKLDQATLQEIGAAIDALTRHKDLKGLLITSAKDSFIVGADIKAFLAMFEAPDEDFLEGLRTTHRIFNQLEELPFPTVAVLNRLALGGGMELAISADFRVANPGAKVGFPEVSLGIYPGWGGTIRLPRMIGADNAVEWIAGAKQYKAEAAFKVGVVDAVVEMPALRIAAIKILERANVGELNWRGRREEKQQPLKLNRIEGGMVFETAKGFVLQQAGPHYPAPIAAISAMQQGAGLHRNEAIEIEIAGFVKMAKTEVARNLVTLFLNDQYLKREAKRHAEIASSVNHAAVLGAGIMGGGIAYQSASRGVPVVMKDINHGALELGLAEASKLLGKQLSRGKIDATKMATVLNQIVPSLSYETIKGADLVVEAVVENVKVKQLVLADVESVVNENTILASNTSTISITKLAENLKRPQNFVGMHFFNPVHRMPLVEVIRGEKSSDEAIATTVSYAIAIGKKPIVVNDCPGFLVNRILFPYFAGFNHLLVAGADFLKVDKALEQFGWPMGPAYLNDVVGMDTAHHATEVMALGFPDRMQPPETSILDLMYEKKRFGQKSGAGFYRYEQDKKGRPKKMVDPESAQLIQSLVGEPKEIANETMIHYLMLPMIIESARCLEDGIVATPQELDMGLIYGIGFPPFRGGALKYADSIGLANLCEIAKEFAHLGKIYQPTERMLEMAKSGQTFYNN